VPPWFGDVVGSKYPDTGTYLRGVVEYVRSHP
jgi:hypothetical protein